MSDSQHNSENQPKTSTQKTPITISKESVVEVAKTRSTKDVFLWIFALAALIASTLVSQYLPRYWVPANDVWTQLGITIGLVIFAIVCLAFTNQGAAFRTLLKDAGIELRRVTWPSKDETIRYTWQVIVVMIIVGILVWLLDTFFNYLIGLVV